MTNGRIGQLQKQRQAIINKFEQAKQSRTRAIQSFREGKINRKKLQNEEKNFERESDRHVAGLRSIDIAINDERIKALGGSIEPKKERKGAFLTPEEKLFERGLIPDVTPAQLSKAQQEATARGERPPTRRKFLEAKRAEEQARIAAETAVKKRDVSAEQRQAREKEIESRRRRAAVRRRQLEKADVTIIKDIQEGISLFGAAKPIAPRPSPRQETVVLPAAELKKEPPPLVVTEFKPEERTFERITGARRRVEELKLEAEKKGLTAFEKILVGASVALGTVQSTKKIKRLAKTAGISLAAAATLVTAGATTPILVGVAGVAGAEVVGQIKEISKEIDPAKRLEAYGDEAANVLAAIGAGGLGAKIGGRIGIGAKEVKVTRPVSDEVLLAEKLDVTKGTKLQKLLFEAEKITKVARTRVEGFLQKVKPPKEPEVLADFLARPDIRRSFRIGDKGIEDIVLLDVPAKIRRFKTEPETFEIKGTGVKRFKTEEGLEITDLTKIDVERVIDPTKFKTKFDKETGDLILERVRKVDVEPTGIKETFLAARTKVTDVFKELKQKVEVDIFGVGLKLPPQEVITRLPTGRVKPIIRTAIEARLGFPIVLPAEQITTPKTILDVEQERKPRVAQELEIDTEQIQKQRQKLKPRLREEVRERGVFEPSLPILEEEVITEQRPILDIDITEDFKPRLEEEVITEEKAKKVVKPKEEVILERLISGEEEPLGERPKRRFKGFHAFARERGRKVRLSKVPLTKRAAEDLATEVVDKTISARGSVKEIKKPLEKPPKDGGTGFSIFNRFKFRDFRTDKKGRRTTPLPEGDFIEKRQFRLDTPEEVKEITIARFLKQRRKPDMGGDSFGLNLGGFNKIGKGRGLL